MYDRIPPPRRLLAVFAMFAGCSLHAEVLKTVSRDGATYHLLNNASWAEAEAEAVQLGGHLVTINDADENYFVLATFGQFAVNHANGVPVSLWLGFNDAAMEGTYVWVSGENPGYTNWTPGEPAGGYENEDYAGMSVNAFGEPGRWHDIDRGLFGDITYGVVEVRKPKTFMLAVGLEWGTSQLHGILGATAVAAAFAPLIGSENIQVLKLYAGDEETALNYAQGQNNLQEIKNALLHLVAPDNAKRLLPGDTLIFYIQTHGGQYEKLFATGPMANPFDELPRFIHTVPFQDTPTRLSYADEYLCLGGIGVINDDYIHTLFSDAATPGIDQLQKIFVIQTCFAGGMIGNTTPEGDSGDLSTVSHSAIIASSSEDDYTYAPKDALHAPNSKSLSYFGDALIASLNHFQTTGSDLSFDTLAADVKARYASAALENKGKLSRIFGLSDQWGIEMPLPDVQFQAPSYTSPGFAWSPAPQPPFAVTSPKSNSVVVPVGSGLILEAGGRLNLVGTPVFTWSKASGPGPVTFDDIHALSTGAQFDAPATYVVRLTAATETASATFDVTVQYLGPTYSQETVIGGQPAPPVYTTGSNSSNLGRAHFLQAGGSGLAPGSVSDGCFEVGKPVTGDFDLYCFGGIADNPSQSTNCRFGLMARPNPGTAATGAKYAAALQRPGVAAEFSYRATPDAASTSMANLDNPTVFGALRLKRVGNVYTAYKSSSGQLGPNDWTQVGTSQTLDLGDSPMVGMVVTSGVSTAVCKVQLYVPGFLQDTAIKTPLVKAGPDVSGQGAIPLNGSVTVKGGASVTDLALRWLRREPGNASVEFANPSLAATTVTIDTPGSYVLRLTASDATVTTFDDVVVTRTGSPIEDWRTASFGAEAGNALVAGDLADYDHDGISNLVEYALSLEPTVADGNKIFVTPQGSLMTVTYPRRRSATDVSVVVEFSADLKTWTAPTTLDENVSQEGDMQTIRSVFQADGDRGFVRLRIVRLPAPATRQNRMPSR